jgi:hypothetical protein
VSPMSPVEPRVDRLNPMETKGRPRSRSNVATPKPQPPPLGYHPSLPIPIPSRIDLHSPGETRKSPAIPQFDENRPSSARPP